jgi:hypothetical protein
MSQARNSFQMLVDFTCRYRRYLKWSALTLTVALGLMILAPFGQCFAADLEYGFLRDKSVFLIQGITWRSRRTLSLGHSLSLSELCRPAGRLG